MIEAEKEKAKKPRKSDGSGHKIAEHLCHICGHESDRRDKYNEHMRTHQPDRVKRFKCQIDNCAYASDYKANLQRHMKSHESDAVEGTSTN